MQLTFPLILASASPRRRELLEEAGLDFRVVVPEVEELHTPGETPAQYAQRNARHKAEEVAAQGNEKVVVLAADTIVVCNAHILEKPQDRMDAVRMLEMLSGRTHQVMTGTALVWGNRLENWVCTTHVTFRTLTLEEIEAYVDSGEPMDKAGAYAIQGGAAGMVSGRQGSYTNVVGLPVEEVIEKLEALGLIET